MMRNKGNKKGFTLIELSLSIAFIAVLSIIIVLLINESISSYRRGMTLNRINSTGMDLVDDMRAAVQNSVSRSVVNECGITYSGNELDNCEKGNGLGLTMVVKKGNVQVGKSSSNVLTDVPLFGAFCTGSFSYIWNSGYFFSDEHTVSVQNNPIRLKYKLSGLDSNSIRVSGDFKLLKVADDARRVCIAAAGWDGPSKQYFKYGSSINSDTLTTVNGTDKAIDISELGSLDDEPIDILSGDIENNLALYSLSSAVPASSNALHDIFYSVSFILGTLQGGINVTATGNYCSTPEGYNSAVSNFDYCAINKFNFAAQATGG